MKLEWLILVVVGLAPVGLLLAWQWLRRRHEDQVIADLVPDRIVAVRLGKKKFHVSCLRFEQACVEASQAMETGQQFLERLEKQFGMPPLSSFEFAQLQEIMKHATDAWYNDVKKNCPLLFLAASQPGLVPPELLGTSGGGGAPTSPANSAASPSAPTSP